MLERINQARGNLIVPSREELAKKIAAKDATASTKVTTKNLKAKSDKSAKDANKDKQEINQGKEKAQGTPLTKDQKLKSLDNKTDKKKATGPEQKTNKEKNKDNNQDKLTTAKTTNTKQAKSIRWLQKTGLKNSGREI